MGVKIRSTDYCTEDAIIWKTAQHFKIEKSDNISLHKLQVRLFAFAWQAAERESVVECDGKLQDCLENFLLRLQGEIVENQLGWVGLCNMGIFNTFACHKTETPCLASI